MLPAVRHNLQRVLHLAVLLVLIGLCTVPVECAAVYGPHSVFVSAESVAALRGSAGGDAVGARQSHVHVTEPLATSTSHADGHSVGHDAPASAPAASDSQDTGARAGLPATAGAMTDALIAIAIFEAPAGITAGAPAPLPPPASQPINHLLPAPEPPPP